MKTRLPVLGVLALAAALGAGSASAAFATDPVTLDAGYVTDDAGVLSASQKTAVEARLQALTENSSADLFVVIVDEFTSPSDNVGWTDAVAADNGLGPEQYLLAIAVDGRGYYISAATGGPLSDGRLDDIEDRIQPLLAQEDWDGAITLAADEIQGDGGAGALRTTLIVVGIVVAALLIWLVVALVSRARRAAAVVARGAMPEMPDPNDPYSTLTDDQVQTQAGAALVRADDAITSSREELGFAVAQFGEAATAGFTGTVETAKAKMSEAFDLRQRLDDAVEDTIYDRRAWHIRIIQLCDEIADLLDDNTEAFDALRRLEQNAPAELQRVRSERAALDPLLVGAATALAGLEASYDPGALSTVADNPAQAVERAALADRSIAGAGQAIDAGRTGEAAFAIRTAEQSIAQSGQLVKAITDLGTELGDIEARSQALIAELQGDVSAAQQVADSSDALAGVVSATAQQLQRAQAGLAGTGRNPQRVFEALTAANTQIDAAITRGAQAVERARRSQQMLDQTLAQAESEIRATREYIDTRRGAVGPTARTRLSQAESALTQALSLRSSNAETARAEAARSLDLARLAASSAQADVYAATPGQWQGDGWGRGGIFGSGSGGGSDLGGDILGGIIGGLLSGGGGGGNSRGSAWRSSGGGGLRSSGFGGGSRSSGRSGRSGGGRF